MAIKRNGVLVSDKEARRLKKLEETPKKVKKSLIGASIYFFEWINMFDWKILSDEKDWMIEVEAWSTYIHWDNTPFKKKVESNRIRYG